MTIKKNNLTLSKADSWRMFNEISLRYDLLNHLLSFGLDIHWRNQLAKFLPNRPRLQILDLATGTADVLISLFKKNPNVMAGNGLDMADKMLDLGRDKLITRKLTDKIRLSHGDAHNISFENESFDVASIAFGIRNMNEPDKVLTEMLRVLGPGGRAVILEFSLPENKYLRAGHLFYLRTIVPLIGFLFSGNYRAYKYLNQTIETFPYGEAFCVLMREAGFKNVKANLLLGGVASIYQGDKL